MYILYISAEKPVLKYENEFEPTPSVRFPLGPIGQSLCSNDLLPMRSIGGAREVKSDQTGLK